MILAQIIQAIKTYWQLAVGLIILCVILYGAYSLHHAGYQEGLAVLEQYKVDQAKLIADAEQIKVAKEKQDAIKTQEIMDAYHDSAITLADRLRDIQTVSGGESVQVASPSLPASSVPPTSSTTGRVDATFALKSSITISATDALRDTLQCTKLQEWVRSVQ